MSKASRDADAKRVLTDLFNGAKTPPKLPTKVNANIETLFGTTTWGFREIVLVVVVARLLDPTYRASTGLYDCNPRALYEGPIIEELRARSIPQRKSGPLNIAKAAKGLTPEWAAQRRPLMVAHAVVEVVRYIESLSTADLRAFGSALCARFLQEAQRVKTLTVVAKPEADPALLARRSIGLISRAPDGGNTAQRVTGLLLQSYHQEMQTGLVVGGYEDRASVTSTTSKKPGDVTEELADGTVLRVYEVTTKKFDAQRVRESYETVRAFDDQSGATTEEVVVLCTPADVHPNADKSAAGPLYLAKLEEHDLTYHFYDLDQWIVARLAAMPPDARLAFGDALAAYVNDYNTSETVKKAWKVL